MFDNLVESGSHKDDISRKGSFLLGTFVIYSIVLVALGILSIYLVNANLPDPSLELLSFVSQVKEPPAPPQPEEQQQQKKPAAAEQKAEYTERAEISAIAPPDTIKVKEEAKFETKAAPPVPVRITGRDYDPANAITGPSGPISMGTGVGTGGPAAPAVVDSGDEAPPPPPPPAPKKNVTISGGVLNGKAISKPAPAYPPIAKAARASGAVTVQITVDESGRVVSAQAVSGHPLLQQAAANAVRNWRFTPTLLSGQPVKVTGQVIVNFNLQ
jgi:periplasmic protein TonB